MVFTNAQTIAFFEDPLQMGIPNATRLQLATEGIVTVDDLEEFDEGNLKQITDNLRRPPGRIPADPAVPLGPTIPTPPFEFGAKSIIRLKAASDIVRYYQTTGRPLTAANMQWDPVVKAFAEHWKSLKARKTTDKPETPNFRRSDSPHSRRQFFCCPTFVEILLLFLHSCPQLGRSLFFPSLTHVVISFSRNMVQKMKDGVSANSRVVSCSRNLIQSRKKGTTTTVSCTRVVAYISCKLEEGCTFLSIHDNVC